jgi:hypothetical protein
MTMPAPRKSDADDANTNPATGSEDAEAIPMNRAERRAKGKVGKQPPAVGKIQPGKTNLNHGPRQYANRRSGT